MLAKGEHMAKIIMGSDDLVIFDTKLSNENRQINLQMHTRGQIDVDIYDKEPDDRYFYGSITMYMKSDKNFDTFIKYLYANKDKICEEIKRNQELLDKDKGG